MEQDYLKTMSARYPDVAPEEFLTGIGKAFDYLERYFVMNIPKEKRIVLIMDYAETIIPADEIAIWTK